MDKDTIRTQLTTAWTKVYADYIGGGIHNETDMAISFAKHLATDEHPVISEALVTLDLPVSNAQKHPDLLWVTKPVKPETDDKCRTATALAVIELKYDYAPKIFIDTAKLALIQQMDDGKPFAEAGFSWSRTWTKISRDDNTVYVVASIGLADSVACKPDFDKAIEQRASRAVDGHLPITKGLLILQIAEPIEGSDFPKMNAITIPGLEKEKASV